MINELEEQRIITEALEENDITVSCTDHKKLKYFTIKGEALFKCSDCNHAWSSYMGTMVVDLYECRAKKHGCKQRCKKCPGSWIVPRFTEDQFRKAIDRVIAKYWERKSQDDDDDDDDDDDYNTMVDDDRHRGNP